MQHHVQMCLDAQGGHFQHMLWSSPFLIHTGRTYQCFVFFSACPVNLNWHFLGLPSSGMHCTI
jgi:hypothetical protein